MTSVRFARKAVEDLDRICAWWTEHRPEAPDLVPNELASALSLLTESPSIGVPYAVLPRGQVRRLLLIDSQVHIYYRNNEAAGEIEILRVWGARRKRGPSIR